MKKTIILAALLMALTTAPASAQGFSAAVATEQTDQPGATSGQSDDIFFEISDPLYEWSEIDSKLAKVQLTSNGLLLESKTDNGVAFSIAELPINLEENSAFVFGAIFTGVKLNEKKMVGLIFDYEDGRNYKGIAVSKKQFEYFVVKDGVSTPVKTGLVKMKGDILALYMARHDGKVEFYLNDLEICTVKRISITSPMFGVFVQGKMKAMVPKFMMNSFVPEETEQSTTDN